MGPYIPIGFFVAAFLSTIAAIALSFQQTVEWAIALGVVAVIFSLAGLFFIWIDQRNQ